jgi:hypothetical protein
MAKVKLGQMVHTKIDSRQNNGHDIAPAFVTSIATNTDDGDNETRVNLRVLLDTGADKRLSNVLVLAKQPAEDSDAVDEDVAGVQRVAWTSTT